MKALFKNKSFVLLFQGSLVSSIGTTLYGFAAGIYMLTLFPTEVYGNDGAFYFALVSSTPIIIRLLISPLAGALVDKWNRIRIIYLTDFINGALFYISLYILVQFNLSVYDQVLLFIVIGGLAGISSAFFGPAVQSSIPDIVGEDLIQAANGAQSIVSSIQGIVGVLAGVILYETLGIEMAILANAVSFILSGLSEMFIKTKYAHPRSTTEKHIMEDIKTGFRYIKSTTGLLDMMKYSLLMNFAFVPLFGVGVPFLFRTELGKNGYHLAASSIVFSVAMMIAGIYIGSKHIASVKHTIVRDLPRLVLTNAAFVVIVFAVTYGYISYMIFFALYVVCMTAMALFLNSVNIPLNTALVKGIEPSYRGRVLSIIQSLAGGATPLAIIIGGIIIQFSNVAFLGLFCVVMVLYPMYGFIKNPKVLQYFDSLDQAKQEVPQYA
ncbi:MFS transporter [Candidatus Xianfuyuplasma coldseepsis]|uniref:MFS transporter n=1 Tax=Candidatus Xianfuyuplasma coldseepsis TaxID=2782163 RepID=A0A7L7KPR6_9MOLU|nr:MFS transporter [Xianfuyuplasma coldseepsis]QMS84703.1 MFS transporter [Xianfuyuplasma coldseepsis]